MNGISWGLSQQGFFNDDRFQRVLRTAQFAMAM
jgi:hypothetical protein